MAECLTFPSKCANCPNLIKKLSNEFPFSEEDFWKDANYIMDRPISDGRYMDSEYVNPLINKVLEDINEECTGYTPENGCDTLSAKIGEING